MKKINILWERNGLLVLVIVRLRRVLLWDYQLCRNLPLLSGHKHEMKQGKGEPVWLKLRPALKYNLPLVSTKTGGEGARKQNTVHKAEVFHSAPVKGWYLHQPTTPGGQTDLTDPWPL